MVREFIGADSISSFLYMMESDDNIVLSTAYAKLFLEDFYGKNNR